MTPVLEFHSLNKEFRAGLVRKKRLKAVDGLDLAVAPGEIFGFLGPNGAGKTTSIKITMGFLRATSGSVSVFQKNAADWRTRERIGFLPENPVIYPFLTGRQALHIFGRMFSMSAAQIGKRTDELAEHLGLDRELDMPIRKHSKGMLQRVGLAQALINDPELVILDEPMSGLDPIGRKMFREVILDLKARGKTVFLSSHILADIEMICDRVGLLHRGRLIMDSPMSELTRLREETGKTLEDVFMEKVGGAQ